MCEVVEVSDDEDACVAENFSKCIPKVEASSPDTEDVPCSSGSNWISYFSGMGFKPSLINKVIEEKGFTTVDGNEEMLLEALLAYSDLRQPMEEHSNAKSAYVREQLHTPEVPSQSLNSLIGRNIFLHDGKRLPLKQEPGESGEDMDRKISSMLEMDFSLDEVAAAMDKLGKNAPISQLTDFIIATRMAQKYKKDSCGTPGQEETIKSNEELFSIMDKTLELLDMGFSESQISTAFEICGSEASLLELTTSIVAPETIIKVEKSTSMAHLKNGDMKFPDYLVKTEEHESADVSQVGKSESIKKRKGKMPMQDCFEPNSSKPKTELTENGLIDLMEMMEQKTINLRASKGQNFWRQIDHYIEADRKPVLLPKPTRNLTSAVAKRPYFLYGSTTELSQSTWSKLSQFLYSIPPEFVDTRQYSALCRIEGYIHNLPTEERFHISPKGPMTIEEAIPSQRKWKPSWDSRRHIILADSDSTSASHLCNRIGNLLAACEGCPSSEQEISFLQHIEDKNLIWIGNYKLSPPEPEHLERLLGYPLYHSQVPGFTSSERSKSLKISFQTDALGYHLSVLKRLFPEGVSVLSFFTGLGGAEVALQRLGIRLKGLVSIEPCEANRKALKKWWDSSGQSGKLIQIESVEKLSSNKLDTLVKTFSGFDFVVSRDASDTSDGLDFSQFMEFVRLFQRLRSFMDRSS